MGTKPKTCLCSHCSSFSSCFIWICLVFSVKGWPDSKNEIPWQPQLQPVSAGLFYPYSHCHLVSRCLNWQRVLGRKFSQLLIDALLWHVQLIHSESGLQPALKSWNSCGVEECWWQYAGVGNTLGTHSPLGLCAQRNLCILKFIPSQVTYPTACTLQKG